MVKIWGGQEDRPDAENGRQNRSVYLLTLKEGVPPQALVIPYTSAAEIPSPSRQMPPMNPPSDPRSYHRWSVWRPMDSLGFAENVLEWKRRDDSTDAMISNVHCALVNYTDPVWSILTIFFIGCMVSADYMDWRTTQNWDGPPNHQP